MPEMLPKWVATSPSDGPTDIRISDIQIALPTPEAADLSGMPITIEHLRGLIGICSQRISIESNTRPSSRISEIDPPQLAAETTVGQFLSAVLNVINVHLPGEKVMALLEGSCVRKLSKFHSGSDNTPFADIDIMIALPHHSMYESAGPDKLPVKEIILLVMREALRGIISKRNPEFPADDSILAERGFQKRTLLTELGNPMAYGALFCVGPREPHRRLEIKFVPVAPDFLSNPNRIIQKTCLHFGDSFYIPINPLIQVRHKATNFGRTNVTPKALHDALTVYNQIDRMAIYSKRYLSPKTIDLFFKNRWIVGPLDPGEMLSPIKFLWQMNMATPHQLTMPHYIRLAAHILRSKSTDKFCAEVDQFLAAHLSGESEKTEVPAFLNALKSALGWIKKEYPEISGADHLDILSNALQSKIDKLIPAGKRGKKEVSRPPFITRMTQVYRCWAQTLSDVADTTFGNSEIFDLLCQSMGIAIGIPLEAPESTPPLLRRIEWHLICRYNSASGAEKQDLFKILEAIPGGIFNPAMASYKSEEWTRLAPKIQQMAEATNTAEWMGPVVRADIALLTSGQLTRGALLDRLLIRIAEKPPIERSRWIQAFWKASGWRSGLIPEEKSDQLIAKLNFSDKASVKLILQQLSAIPEAEGFIMELENRFPGVLLEIPDRIESLVGLPLVARAIQSELLRRLQLPEGMAENAYRLTREEIHLCMNAYLKSAHLPKAALSVLEARAKAGAGKGVLSSATFSAFKTKSIFDPITTILLAKAIETGSLGPDLVSEAKEIVDRSEEGINPESAMVIYRKWILNTVSIKQSVPFRIIEDVMTKAIKYGAGLTRDELRTVLTWQTHFLSKHRSSQKKLGPLAVKLIGIIHHTGPKTDDWKLLADSWAQLFTKPEAKASFFMDIWTILFRNPDRIEEDPLRQCVLVSSKVVLDLAELAVRLIGPCPEPNAHYTDIFRSIASLFVIIRSVELNESDIYHGISGEIAPALFKIFAENKMWGGVLAMSESVLLSNHPYALAEHLGLYIDGYRLLDDSPIGKRFKLLFADLVKWVVPNRAVPEIYSIIASIDCDGDVQIPDLSQLGIRNLETREIVSTYHPEALMQLIAGGMEFLPSEEELDSISESYIVNFPKIEKQLKINFGLTETVMILLKDAAQFKIITHKECARLCYDSIEKLLELFETESFSHANVLAAHDALAASGAPEALSSEGILLKERVQLSLFRAITSFIDFVSALFVTGFNKYIVFNIGFGNQLFLKSDFEIPRKTLAKLPGLTNRYLIAAGNSLPENLIGKDAGLVLACVMQSIPEKESLDIVQRHRDFFVKNLIAYECFLKQLQDYQLLGLAAAIPSIVNPTSSVTSAAEAVAFSATGTV